MFRMLCIFQRNHGHCLVSYNRRADSLGQWVARQQAKHQRGRLSPERTQRLEQIGFVFEAGAETGLRKAENEARWEKSFAALIEFKRIQGHFHVPRRGAANGTLGVWVQNLRRQKRRGRLREDRRRRLEEAQFTWAYESPNWDRKFEELLAYKKRFGHCDVPARWPENRPLAHWVDNQRCWRRRGELRQDRIQRLDDIGFSWSTRFSLNKPRGSLRHQVKRLEDFWDAMFEKLKRFKRKYGHCSVPKSDSAGGRLHNWVQRRRAEWKRGLLREDRRLRLEELGFDLKHRSFAWERKFEEMLAFKRRFGHCGVPARWPGNRSLGRWVDHQRCWRRKGRLSQDRIDRLNEIGFSWSQRLDLEAPAGSYQEHVRVRDQIWHHMFAHLVRFKDKHGHCNVPKSDSSQRRLHRWVQRQREDWRKGRIREARKRRLEELGFEWGTTNPSWDHKFAELAAYQQRFGHCDVPVRRPGTWSLGHWVSNQRCFRRRDMLSQDRIDRLDQIGFPWTSGRYTGAGPKRGEIPPYCRKRWDSMFAKLKRFKREHGDLNVPWRDKTKPSLWGWFTTQRSHWRHGRLQEERRRRLEELGVSIPSQRQ
jgi:hypothetical protein